MTINIKLYLRNTNKLKKITKIRVSVLILGNKPTGYYFTWCSISKHYKQSLKTNFKGKKTQCNDLLNNTS